MPTHPGAVNWMTAGQGITHSERSAEAARRAPQTLFGNQA
jgi:redox-sensitive bicupin YhaK (pirin superfamily)